MSENELRYAVAPITHIDVRDNTSQGTYTMSGYAAVFNQQTTLLDSKFLKLTESVDVAAFDRVLRDQRLGQPSGVVHFNFGHDMNRAVAATDVPAGQPGSLKLSADAHGLHFLAKVSRDDPDGRALAVKMEHGVVKQASFAFTIAESAYRVVESDDDGPDIEHRTIMELSHLYDVCATAQGAYSSTVAGLRSYSAALGQPDQGDRHHQPDLGEGSVASPSEVDAATEVPEPVEWPDLTEAVARHRPIPVDRRD
jgi:HK97 family phage prohead protease